MGYVLLAGAILSEVFGSSMLKLSSDLEKSKLPVLGVALGYLLSFYLLSLTLITIPLSFAYAVWSGVGTALTAVIGFTLFKEKIRLEVVLGIALLIVGIVLMRL